MAEDGGDGSLNRSKVGTGERVIHETAVVENSGSLEDGNQGGAIGGPEEQGGRPRRTVRRPARYED